MSSVNSGNLIKHLNFPKMIFTEFSESKKIQKVVWLAQAFYYNYIAGCSLKKEIFNGISGLACITCGE